MTYYFLLGVPEDADADTIRSAFRALARQYHPDAGEGSSADRFREILIAYETLSDPRRRGDYDRSLQNRRAPRVQFVEPLRAQADPEPMLRPRSRVGYENRMYEPLGPTRLHQLIDEFFQSWDELFLGTPRRRDRV
jgi:curved DNA-binding protein CbpA